jgi:hypothetical protein
MTIFLDSGKMPLSVAAEILPGERTALGHGHDWPQPGHQDDGNAIDQHGGYQANPQKVQEAVSTGPVDQQASGLQGGQEGATGS